MLPNFNRSLDDLRGAETETTLAGKLGVSPDTLSRMRKGSFPRTVQQLRRFPHLLCALAHDDQAERTPVDESTKDGEIIPR